MLIHGKYMQLALRAEIRSAAAGRGGTVWPRKHRAVFLLCGWSYRAPSELLPQPPAPWELSAAMFPAIEQLPSPNPCNHYLKYHWSKGCSRKAALGQLWWSAKCAFSLFVCFHKVCRNAALLESFSRPGVGLESAKRLKALHVHGSCLAFLMKPCEKFPWPLPACQLDWPGKPRPFS